MGLDLSRALVRLSSDPLLKRIEVSLGELSGGPFYLVGGYLRDQLLQIEPSERDIDLTLAGEPGGLAKALAPRLQGSVVRLDVRTWRVVFDVEGTPWQLDLSQLKGPTIEADLQVRDFTVGALGFPLGQDFPLLLDPLGGVNDLERGIVRMTSPAVFEEDPLRLIRGVRLACQLGFSIEGKTQQAILEKAGLLQSIPGERVKAELFKIFVSPSSVQGIALLDRVRLLRELVPEVEAMKQVPASKPHRYPLWTHSLATLRSLEELVERLEEILPRHGPWLRERLKEELEASVTRLSLLKLVAILHDVGKPRTRTERGGKVRFLGHSEEGAKLLAGLFTRLKLGRKASVLGEKLVLAHLRPILLSRNEQATPRARYRFFQDLQEAAPEVLLHAWADLQATVGEGHPDVKRYETFLRMMFDDLTERFEKARTKPLLGGHDLIEAFQLEPGPFLGFILERVKEAQAAGELQSREEALAFVKVHLERWRLAFTAGVQR